MERQVSKMKRYTGGQIVEKGKYYNPSSGTLAEIMSTGKLPGGSGEKYLKVNSVTMMILAPVATLLFVILLPVAYVACFATLWGYKLLRLLLGLEVAHPLRR